MSMSWAVSTYDSKLDIRTQNWQTYWESYSYAQYSVTKSSLQVRQRKLFFSLQVCKNSPLLHQSNWKQAELKCNLSSFFFSLSVSVSLALSHTCFWKVNNNKIPFSSLILTRRVSVYLFISITHHTSFTLRSVGGRGVKMTLCVGFFTVFFF